MGQTLGQTVWQPVPGVADKSEEAVSGRKTHGFKCRCEDSAWFNTRTGALPSVTLSFLPCGCTTWSGSFSHLKTTRH